MKSYSTSEYENVLWCLSVSLRTAFAQCTCKWANKISKTYVIIKICNIDVLFPKIYSLILTFWSCKMHKYSHFAHREWIFTQIFYE